MTRSMRDSVPIHRIRCLCRGSLSTWQGKGGSRKVLSLVNRAFEIIAAGGWVEPSQPSARWGLAPLDPSHPCLWLWPQAAPKLRTEHEDQVSEQLVLLDKAILRRTRRSWCLSHS